MKSLCTFAALAVVTAFAHGHFTDALLRSSGRSLSSGPLTHKKLNAVVECLQKINTFREGLGGGANDYKEVEDVKGDPPTQSEKDLETFLQDQTCDGLRSGKFAHMSEDQDGGPIFVFTAQKSAAAARGDDGACDAALEQWESGFTAFNGKHPPVYKDFDPEAEPKVGMKAYRDVSGDEGGANPYQNPNAAALASLLQAKEQHLVCGTLEDCTDTSDVLLCYFKPSNISTTAVPVDPKLWHALEAKHQLKPTLEKKEETDGNDSLKAVNEARAAAGLQDKFTNPMSASTLRRRRVKRSEPLSGEIEEAVQKVLYSLTCDDISKSKINPAPSTEDFTVIYYVKDTTDAGAKARALTAPTIEEAVTYWQTGFDKLKYKRPPVFKKNSIKLPGDDDVSEADDTSLEGSEIYSDSAVAGYASIMADGAHSMACFAATGCDEKKAALICVLHTATLVEDKQPISKATWDGIMKSKGYPLPTFSPLEASKNCLEEMNAVRTQEKLGLKPFLAKTETSKSGTELVLSTLMESVTCQAIGGTTTESAKTTGPEFKVTDGATSLMYHMGTEISCSEAVEAWKKGSEKFSAAPPAYKSDEPAYKDSAATNFVSLISDGERTATCYSAGCDKKGIVCELSPAALKDGTTPVSEDTWKKYNESAETSGVAGASKAALVGTIVMTLAAGVFFL